MERNLLVKNGVLVTEFGVINGDVLIKEGVISAIGQGLREEGMKTVDTGGCLVLPGIVDPHVQLEVFRGSSSMTDDFDTGTKAAACGGVTTIIDFADQPRGRDALEYLRERKAIADAKVNVDYTLHMSITDLSGDTLKEIPIIVQEEFVTSFKLYLTYRRMGRMITEGQTLAVMREVAKTGGIVGVHAESDSIVEYLTEECIQNGRTDPRYFPQSRSDVAEAASVASTIEIARATGCDLYVHHVSTGAGIELIASAKRNGVRVWAETCPHYLILTDEVYQGEKRYLYVMNPPLRAEEDRNRLWKGIQTNVVDTIGTDHCSYKVEQKVMHSRFDQVPPGVPGIEILLPVMYTEGVSKGRMTLSRLVELLCSNPAKVFGLFPRKGTILVGSDGDLVIFNPAREWTINASKLRTNSDFCPFEGMKMAGSIEKTILRGEIIYADGSFCGTANGGRFVKGIREKGGRLF